MTNRADFLDGDRRRTATTGTVMLEPGVSGQIDFVNDVAGPTPRVTLDVTGDKFVEVYQMCRFCIDVHHAAFQVGRNHLRWGHVTIIATLEQNHIDHIAAGDRPLKGL